MTIIKGVIQNGQVFLPVPSELPNGTNVTVLADEQMTGLGIAEDAWPTRPEEIALLLRRIDELEPFEISAEEEVDVGRWRDQVKEHTLRSQNSAIDGLFE